MTMSVKVGGVWKPITALSIKVGGLWKPVTSGKVRVAGVWKEFFATASPGAGAGALTLTGSGTISKSYSGPSAGGTVTTNNYGGFTVTGATGTVTYSWARYSAPDVQTPFTIYSPTTATPWWQARVNDVDSPHTETWRCTATDSLGNTGTKDVVVSLSWSDTRYL